MLIDLVLERKIEPGNLAELPRDGRAARDQDPCCGLVSGLRKSVGQVERFRPAGVPAGCTFRKEMVGRAPAKLGKKGLEVSAMGFGCMGLSHAYGLAIDKRAGSL
jgi:hypothetical protein